MDKTKYIKTVLTVFFLFVSCFFAKAQFSINSLAELDEGDMMNKTVTVNTNLVIVGIGNEVLLWDGNNFAYAQKSKFSGLTAGYTFNGFTGKLNKYDPNIFYVSQVGETATSNLPLPEPRSLSGTTGLETNMYYVEVKGEIQTQYEDIIFTGSQEYPLVKYDKNNENITTDYLKKDWNGKKVTLVGYVEPDQANYIVVLGIWEGDRPKDIEISVNADPKEGGSVYIDEEKDEISKIITPNTEHLTSSLRHPKRRDGKEGVARSGVQGSVALFV